jgi:hypothetical protein
VALDERKIDRAVLALLYLGLHDGARAWKGFDWDRLPLPRRAWRRRGVCLSRCSRQKNDEPEAHVDHGGAKDEVETVVRSCPRETARNCWARVIAREQPCEPNVQSRFFRR